jgi:DNA-directed RNA polymerase specialized sigma24 family protein
MGAAFASNGAGGVAVRVIIGPDRDVFAVSSQPATSCPPATCPPAATAQRAGSCRPLERKYTDADLRAAAAEGLSAAEIAARFGVSRGGVLGRAKRRGITLLRRPPAIRKASAKDLLAAAAEGLNASEIAARFGMSRVNVYKRLRCLGWPTRSWHPAQKASADDLRAAVAEGLTAPEIAARFDMKPDYVRQRCARMGLQPVPVAAKRAAARDSLSQAAVAAKVPDVLPLRLPRLRMPKPAPVQAERRAAEPPPAHPFFDSVKDVRIIEAGRSYAALAALAAGWGQPIQRVIARAHQLRG